MISAEKADRRRLDLIIARKIKNLTLRELAGRVGVSRTILSRLEQDWRVDTSPAVKTAICRELDLPTFPHDPNPSADRAVVT